MTMKTILIVGAAGSGKTWIMKKIIEQLKLHILGCVGMFAFHRDEKFIVLGKYDGTTYEGSDRLSMAIMRDLPKFKAYANGSEHKYKFVICEGDRFMNKTFIESMRPYIIKITDDGKAGRAKRGSNQTERQLKSIATRVANTEADMLVEKSVTALKVIKEITDGKRKV